MAITINVKGAQGLDQNLNAHQESFSGSSFGAFNSWWAFATSGTEYGVESGNGTAFVAEGDLYYTLFSAPQHVLYGEVDTLRLGTDLQGRFTSDMSVANEAFEFTGLDLSSAKSEGRDGVVHKVMYGLLKPTKDVDGNQGVQHLIDVLDGQQLNVVGNNGANVLHGYAGNDTLTGNGGSDTFQFGALQPNADTNVPDTYSTSFGNDTITDYQSGNNGDKIDLVSGITVTGYSNDSSGDLVITTTGGTITVEGITSAGDITFA